MSSSPSGVALKNRPKTDSPASEPAPGAQASTSAPATGESKPRASHYAQTTIRVHENSKVDLSDLQTWLTEKVGGVEGEEVKELEGGKRFKGRVFVLGPVSRTQASAADRAAKLKAKFIEAAKKAGLDPAELLSAASESESTETASTETAPAVDTEAAAR